MKAKTILASALGALMLFACNKEDTGPEKPQVDMGDAAYISVKIKSEPGTRSSYEKPDEASERALSSLYLITFDNAGNVLAMPNSSRCYIELTGSGAVTSPDAFRVSTEVEKILVIANPGTELQAVIYGLNPANTFATLNQAIVDIDLTEINTFTMINSGDEGSNPQEGDVITDPLLTLDPAKVYKVSAFTSSPNPEQAAKDAAETPGNRMDIKIERLAAKIELKVKAQLEILPAGATFEFGKWTLDGINTTFYPYAEKTLLSVPHTPPGSYTFNFYTKDPNFSPVPVGEGIDYATIDPDTYDPELVAPYTWLDKNEVEYAIENTMAAAEQKYGNATRVVIKGQYYPKPGWTGDWFSFAYTNYEDLDALKAAYQVAGATNLQAACDKMFTKISNYATANGLSLDGNNFLTLSLLDLDKIPNGGEVVKGGSNDVIRWYKNGLNYYYYEIRHDNETVVEMAFGKYGVVRNNWYSLTLGKVNGAGTPWYPDIDNPGPGDPDPVDPIDESAGYIGIEIEIAPWIIWDTEIVI